MLNDFLTFLRNDEPALAMADMPEEQGAVYTPPDSMKLELKDIERAFARLFSTQDGHKVLAHLQVMTFQRALGPTCSDEQLRYVEGQRAMMGMILRLIDRGRGR